MRASGGSDEKEYTINIRSYRIRCIASGDSVFLSTECGEISLIANITYDIREGTVHAPSGGGGAHQIGLWSSAHVNSIISPGSRDAISGYPVFKAQLCEVNAAPKPAYLSGECVCSESDMILPPT